jgi:hypothetical protein
VSLYKYYICTSCSGPVEIDWNQTGNYEGHSKTLFRFVKLQDCRKPKFYCINQTDLPNHQKCEIQYSREQIDLGTFYHIFLKIKFRFWFKFDRNGLSNASVILSHNGTTTSGRRGMTATFETHCTAAQCVRVTKLMI